MLVELNLNGKEKERPLLCYSILATTEVGPGSVKGPYHPSSLWKCKSVSPMFREEAGVQVRVGLPTHASLMHLLLAGDSGKATMSLVACECPPGPGPEPEPCSRARSQACMYLEQIRNRVATGTADVTKRDYLVDAATQIHLALERDVSEDYEAAFNHYQNGVDVLLRGVHGEGGDVCGQKGDRRRPVEDPLSLSLLGHCVNPARPP